MENRPLLEKLAWVAGILSLVFMVMTWKPSESALPPPPPPPSPQPEVAQVSDTLKVGTCNLDTATIDGLKKNGLYDEMLYQCNSGKASTIGQSFRMPTIHPDERFQYFNPVEFNNIHGLSDGRVTNAALYQNVTDKISLCFSQSTEQGASPHERIDLELDCLQQNGMKAQDKVYFMLVENARTEGRNALA